MTVIETESRIKNQLGNALMIDYRSEIAKVRGTIK